MRYLRVMRLWRLSIVAFIVFSIPCAFMVVALRNKSFNPRSLAGPTHLPSEADLVDARKEAVERSTHFEQLLVALGSFELSIVAYITGVVLGKEARIQNPRLFYGLFTVLTCVTTVTYLHTFRVYCAYSLYIAQLEQLITKPGLRTMTQVFYLAMNPNVPKNTVLPIVTGLAGSLELIALYPVVVFCAAAVAFARRLEMGWDVAIAVVICALGWSFLYAYPGMEEFVRLSALVH